MATRDNHTLLLLPDIGSGVEVDADGDTVFFEQHGILGGWSFEITAEDWEELKKFVDKKMAER